VGAQGVADFGVAGGVGEGGEGPEWGVMDAIGRMCVMGAGEARAEGRRWEEVAEGGWLVGGVAKPA
jgi:hypothetical protein